MIQNNVRLECPSIDILVKEAEDYATLLRHNEAFKVFQAQNKINEGILEKVDTLIKKDLQTMTENN